MRAWRGVSIIMGIMNVPVKLYPAAEDHDIKRHNLHTTCNTQLSQVKRCEKCDVPVDDTELVKGYEVSKEQNVILSEEELTAIQLKSSQGLEIVEFTASDKVDVRMPEKHYFVAPEKVGRKAFTILLETMRATNLYAIGRVVFSESKETLVLIRPYGDVLLLHTLHWADELKDSKELQNTTVAISDRERELGRMLVEAMKGDGNMAKFHDEYQEKLQKLIETKLAGGKIEVPAAGPAVAPIEDVAEALIQSLKLMGVKAEAA